MPFLNKLAQLASMIGSGVNGPPMGSLPGDGTIAGRSGMGPYVMNMSGQNTTSPVGSILRPSIGQGNSPLGALADSSDATGSDQQSPLAQLAGQQNQTPILDQYSQLLKNFPQYQEPSRGRKILGALAGLGAGSSPVGIADGQVVGFKYDPKSAAMAKEDVEQGPYNRKLERWGMQAKALGEGATVEERKLQNQRMMQHDTELNAARDEANRIREELGTTRNELLKEKDDNIKAQKQNELEEKIRQANMKADESEQRAKLAAQGMENTKAYHEAMIAAQEARFAAQKAQHELDNSRADAKMEEMQRLHDAEIAKWKNAGGTGAGTETTTERTEIKPAIPPKNILGIDIPFTGTPEQKTKTVETTSTRKPIIGPTTGNVQMKGPDGKLYQVPADKVEEAKTKHGMVVVQ